MDNNSNDDVDVLANQVRRLLGEPLHGSSDARGQVKQLGSAPSSGSGEALVEADPNTEAPSDEVLDDLEARIDAAQSLLDRLTEAIRQSAAQLDQQTQSLRRMSATISSSLTPASTADFTPETT